MVTKPPAIHETSVTITEDDRRLLTHVARFGITTRRALATPALCGTIWSVKTRLRRLAGPQDRTDVSPQARSSHGEQYLRSDRLGLGAQRFFRLTARGYRAIGLKPVRKPELGVQALASRYAVLMHCCVHGEPRLLFTRHEFHAELAKWCERLWPCPASLGTGVFRRLG